MSTVETRTVVYARADHDRDTLMHEGVTGKHESYGKVVVCRRTTTERIADGDVRRVLHRSAVEEVLLELNAKEAAHLTRTLVDALSAALTVKPGLREEMGL